jgi:hypothetical protein
MVRSARYTPRDRAVVACLIGLGDHRLVSLSPDAAKLLRQALRVRTIKDVLELPAWPYGRLRIAIERWPLIE